MTSNKDFNNYELTVFFEDFFLFIFVKGKVLEVDRDLHPMCLLDQVLIEEALVCLVRAFDQPSVVEVLCFSFDQVELVITTTLLKF